MNSCVNPVIYGSVNEKIVNFFHSVRKRSHEVHRQDVLSQCDYSFPSYSMIKAAYRPSLVVSEEICMQSINLIKTPNKLDKVKLVECDVLQELDPN